MYRTGKKDLKYTSCAGDNPTQQEQVVNKMVTGSPYKRFDSTERSATLYQRLSVYNLDVSKMRSIDKNRFFDNIDKSADEYSWSEALKRVDTNMVEVLDKPWDDGPAAQAACKPALCNVFAHGKSKPAVLFWMDRILSLHNNKLEREGDVVINSKYYNSDRSALEFGFSPIYHYLETATCATAYEYTVDGHESRDGAENLFIHTTMVKPRDGGVKEYIYWADCYENVCFKDEGNEWKCHSTGRERAKGLHGTSNVVALRETRGMHYKYEKFHYGRTAPLLQALVVIPPYDEYLSEENNSENGYQGIFGEESTSSTSHASTKTTTNSIALKISTPKILEDVFEASYSYTSSESTEDTYTSTTSIGTESTEQNGETFVSYTFLPTEEYVYKRVVDESSPIPLTEEERNDSLKFIIIAGEAISGQMTLDDYNKEVLLPSGIPYMATQSEDGDLTSYIQAYPNTTAEDLEAVVDHIPGSGFYLRGKGTEITAEMNASVTVTTTLGTASAESHSKSTSVENSVEATAVPGEYLFRVTGERTWGSGSGWTAETELSKDLKFGGVLPALKVNCKGKLSYVVRQMLYKRGRYFKRVDGDHYEQTLDKNEADYMQEFYVSDWVVINLDQNVLNELRAPFEKEEMAKMYQLAQKGEADPNKYELVFENGRVVLWKKGLRSVHKFDITGMPAY